MFIINLRKYIFGFIAFLLATISFNIANSDCLQTVHFSGIVLDSITHEPIVDAMVCLDEICDPPCWFEPWFCGLCDWTDSQGYFSITRTCTILEGEYFVGYFCLTLSNPRYKLKRRCFSIFIFAPCFGNEHLQLPNIESKIELASISLDVEEEPQSFLPKKFTLNQNYPNPFNPDTRIEFMLSRSTFVTLEIYNVLGKKVRTLVKERLSAGYKAVTWDGKNEHDRSVTSGIYLYRFKAGDFVETKKMMLLK